MSIDIKVVMRLPYGSINVPSLSSSLTAGKIVGYIMLGNTIFVYVVAIINLCVYGFRLLLYTHLPFLGSAYAILVCFIIRSDHF